MKESYVLGFQAINLRALLAVALLVCTGCAGQLCRLPDDCAIALSQATIGWRIRDFCETCPLDNCISEEGTACGSGGSDIGCSGIGYCDEGYCDEGCSDEGCSASCDVDNYDTASSMHVYEDEVWLDEPRPARRQRIKRGPRPIPYEPPMPPQFLLVPTSSQ